MVFSFAVPVFDTGIYKKILIQESHQNKYFTKNGTR